MCGGSPLDVVTDAIDEVASGVGDVVGGAVDFVTEHPLETALLAAGVYYAPEIGAFVNENGAILSAEEAGVGSTAGGIDLGGGITMGADGSIYGGTFTGAEGSLMGMDAATAAATGLGGGTLASMTPEALAAAGAAGAGAGSSIKDALLLGAGSSLVGGVLGAGAAKDAAATQAAAADRAAAQQQANFNTINSQQAPYRAAGYGALNQLGNLGSGTYQIYDENGKPIGKGEGTGYLQHQFNTQDLYSGLAPNYDFMLKQGQMANQRMGNVAGGALSGNTLQGLNKFSQDYAGNAYQNAFNNYQQQRQNIYNTLAGIAGIGQTGQTATNNAATNATNAITQLGVGSAAAQAAGTIGQTNAYTNALNNVVNNYTLASLLQQGGRVA